ncbi:MAG: hypothetical protein AMXMBFR53_08350 [Gemmatimonadota bacterium]
MMPLLRRTALIAAVLGCASPPGAASQVRPGLVVPPTLSWSARADRLLDAGDAVEAMETITPMLGDAPLPEALWRAARAEYQMGILATSQDSANAWFRMAVVHAEAALEGAGDHPEALRWAVAANGSVANAPGVGPRETARTARRAWELARRLLVVAPDDPVGHSAMGSLHAEVLTMSFFERLLARAILGEMVGGARWEDALSHHRRAVELDGGTVLYRLELGKALGWHGDLAGARATLAAALDAPPLTPLDRVHHEAARAWLRRFGGAPDGRVAEGEAARDSTSGVRQR